MSAGDDADSGHVGVLAAGELSRARGCGQIDDEASSLLLGSTMLTVEHRVQFCGDVHDESARATLLEGDPEHLRIRR